MPLYGPAVGVGAFVVPPTTPTAGAVEPAGVPELLAAGLTTGVAGAAGGGVATRLPVAAWGAVPVCVATSAYGRPVEEHSIFRGGRGIGGKAGDDELAVCAETVIVEVDRDRDRLGARYLVEFRAERLHQVERPIAGPLIRGQPFDRVGSADEIDRIEGSDTWDIGPVGVFGLAIAQRGQDLFHLCLDRVGGYWAIRRRQLPAEQEDRRQGHPHQEGATASRVARAYHRDTSTFGVFVAGPWARLRVRVSSQRSQRQSAPKSAAMT